MSLPVLGVWIEVCNILEDMERGTMSLPVLGVWIEVLYCHENETG